MLLLGNGAKVISLCFNSGWVIAMLACDLAKDLDGEESIFPTRGLGVNRPDLAPKVISNVTWIKRRSLVVTLRVKPEPAC